MTVGNLILQKEPEIQRDLIIARARSVHLAAGVAGQLDQSAFDRDMDVFVGDVELELRRISISCLDRAQALYDLHGLGARDQLHLREHVGMRDRAADVVAKQSAGQTATRR